MRLDSVTLRSADGESLRIDLVFTEGSDEARKTLYFESGYDEGNARGQFRKKAHEAWRDLQWMKVSRLTAPSH